MVKRTHIAKEYTSALKDFFSSPMKYCNFQCMYTRMPRWDSAQGKRVTNDTTYDLPKWDYIVSYI